MLVKGVPDLEWQELQHVGWMSTTSKQPTSQILDVVSTNDKQNISLSEYVGSVHMGTHWHRGAVEHAGRCFSGTIINISSVAGLRPVIW